MKGLESRLELSESGGSPVIRRFIVAAFSVFLTLSGCAPAEAPPPPEPEPIVLEGPPIRQGAFTDDEAQAAAQLIIEAQELLSDGRVDEALEHATTVEARYPESPGSSLAIWIQAQAFHALEDWAEGEVAAEFYVDLVSGDSSSSGRGYLLRAQIRRAGNLAGGIEAIFEIPEEADEPELVQAEALAELWASGLATPELRDLIVEAPRHPRILPVFLTELAVRRYLSGDEPEARARAEEALAMAPGPEVVRRATDVIEGRIDEELEVAAVIGGILPITGSPAVSRLALDISEGIEVALAADEEEFSRPIRFLPVEDATEPSDMAAAFQTLEGARAAGVIGPLQDAALIAAVRSRETLIPVLSPTTRLIPPGTEGVFSMNGVDPSAGQALARLVLDREIREIVVVHTSSAEMEEEYRWFREAYVEGGGAINRVLNYPPGATGFQSQMREILSLRPRGLVFLLPPSDVELLAPQIPFYGVDELPGLTVFGNQSWTSEGVLQSVQARSTEGVFSITSWVGEGEFGPGWEGFVEAYEEHFRRSLRSPTPALGYDAARLLLRAAREGGGTPEGTLQALGRVQGVAGATGFLSVEGGRIRRSFVPVRIENRRPVLLTP